jgi:UDP:flavonoid glycosyltransferase YjiC (YdhE family)
MKIVLATFGSRGDVQPMLALALALRSAGHRVVLAAPPEKADWAKRLGCPFRPLGSDVTAFIDTMSEAHTFGAALRFTSYIRNELAAQFDAFPDILAGSDLAVGASLAFGLSSVAESMGIPYRYIAFTPQLLPSSLHPFMAFKRQDMPRWFNRVTWRFTFMLDRLHLTRLVNVRRRRLGLPCVRDVWYHILGGEVLVASDKEIAAVPPDVEVPALQTGYMHLLGTDEENAALEDFLSAGPPPIYAGFGSMPRQDQARNLPLVTEAARLAGQRVIISRFWDNGRGLSKDRDVFFISRYPHLKLFPAMAAVIHHGGAGTTATAARSGAPQVIVPHVLDQYYWGHQVHRSHLGVRPIWRSRLTSENLAAAVQECLSNEMIRRRALEVSASIRSEDGLRLAVRSIAG